MPLRSPCYLFYGMEAEEGSEASKREKRSWGWCFLTSANVITFYLLFILWNGGRGRKWSEQERKEIMRMMFPDLCQCHNVLPVIYFTVLRQRKDVKRAREKKDHKDDVSWLLPMSHRSTCSLFYGLKTEERREKILRMLFHDIWYLQTVLPVICFMVWRKRKSLKRSREKRDHEGNDFWRLPFAYYSTCNLFYGMEAVR